MLSFNNLHWETFYLATAIIKKLRLLLIQKLLYSYMRLSVVLSRPPSGKSQEENLIIFFLDAQYDKYLIRISMSYIIKIVVVTTNVKSDTRYNVSGQNEASSISCNYSFIQNVQ